MSQFFRIHPDNPQGRLLEGAVRIIRSGGLIAYPTDSCYALGALLGDRWAAERIRRLRGKRKGHHFTLVCRDLSEISTYARLDKWAYRLVRSLTPGPYTFVLVATREVPRRLQDPKRRSIGLRVPNHPIAQALLAALDEPLISSTLHLPGDDIPLTDAQEIRDRLERRLDLIVDGDSCGIEPTTVLDLSKGDVQILREGKGSVTGLT